MKISIVGSWKAEDKSEWSLEGSYEDFSRACNLIGQHLARNERKIIIGSSSNRTADFHVVSGMLDIVRSERLKSALITVIRPEKGTNSLYDTLAAKQPGVFVFRPGNEIRWAESHLIA